MIMEMNKEGVGNEPEMKTVFRKTRKIKIVN